MPLYNTSEEWQHYTSLLIQARPTTTRIVTKYTIPRPLTHTQLSLIRKKKQAYLDRAGLSSPPSTDPPSSDKTSNVKNGKRRPSGLKAPTMSDPSLRPASGNSDDEQGKSKTFLEFRTYCPVAGVVLKYRTDKAAEIGRLWASLGKMGGLMSGKVSNDEEEKGDEMDVDVKVAEDGAREEVEKNKKNEGGDAELEAAAMDVLQNIQKQADNATTQVEKGQVQTGGSGSKGKKKKGKR